MKVFLKDLKFTSLLSIFYLLTMSCSAFCNIEFYPIDRVLENYYPSTDPLQKEFVGHVTDWLHSNYSRPSLLSHIMFFHIPQFMQYIIRTDIPKHHILVSFEFLNDYEIVLPYFSSIDHLQVPSAIVDEYTKTIQSEGVHLYNIKSLLEKDSHFAVQLKTYGIRHFISIIISSEKFKNHVEFYGIESFVELFKDKFKENEELIKNDISELEHNFRKNIFLLFYSKVKSYLRSYVLKDNPNHSRNIILKKLCFNCTHEEREYLYSLDPKEFMKIWESAKEQFNFKTSKELLDFLSSYSDKLEFFELVQTLIESEFL